MGEPVKQMPLFGARSKIDCVSWEPSRPIAAIASPQTKLTGQLDPHTARFRADTMRARLHFSGVPRMRSAPQRYVAHVHTQHRAIRRNLDSSSADESTGGATSPKKKTTVQYVAEHNSSTLIGDGSLTRRNSGEVS